MKNSNHFKGKLKLTITTFLLVTLLFTFAGCSNSDKTAESRDSIPTINMAWDFDLHAAALLAAVSKQDSFKDSGYYLKAVVEKEQYELCKADGTKMALINTIVTKGSSETAVMMGQGEIDCCVNSSTGMMGGIDQGTDIRFLCPIHVDGISLVVDPDSPIDSWKDFMSYIKGSQVPVKVGYHSPTSAPRVLIQKVMMDAGLDVSEDPENMEADVTLVNLNGSKNLLPSLSNDLVDAWVGPSHHPEMAENEGVGKIAVKLADFPPKGQWLDFPCCVFAATDEQIEKNPEIYDAMVDLLTYSANWCQENKEEAAPVLSQIVGIPEEVVKEASIVYTTSPTKNWYTGEKLYVDMLNTLGIFEGDMKGKTYDEVKDSLFYFDFLEN